MLWHIAPTARKIQIFCQLGNSAVKNSAYVFWGYDGWVCHAADAEQGWNSYPSDTVHFQRMNTSMVMKALSGWR